MRDFDIDLDDLIQFMRDSGAIVTDSADGNAGIIIDGKLTDPVKALREAFNTPIND